MVIVSARTPVLAAANTNSAANEKTNLPNRDMGFLLVSAIPYNRPPYPHFGRKEENFAGQLQISLFRLCDGILKACLSVVNPSVSS
jgi:hypothetical protein